MMSFRNADFGAYEVRKLEPEERVKSFNCGDADLNDFILNQSDLYRKALLAVLLDFIKSYFLVDNKTGCRFITVDTYSAALSFYETNDFQYLRKEESDNITRLLYYDINDMVG